MIRTALTGLALVLAACAGASSTQTAPPCTAESAAEGAACDWRALNARRPPQSLVGYYEPTNQNLEAQLAIVEGAGGAMRVGLSAYSRSTTHLCSAILVGVSGDGRIVLEPVQGWGLPENCDAAVEHADRRGEIEFSMNNACSDACGARAFPSGRYRLRRHD